MSAATIRTFISYGTPDREFADKLSEALKQHGIVPFVDHTSIGAGQDWEDRLAEEIINANIVLVILSPDSIKSTWVRRECTFAESNGIPIIPIMHRNTKLPLWIIEKQFADFQLDFDHGLRVLLLALRPAAAPSPSLVPQAQQVAPPPPNASPRSDANASIPWMPLPQQTSAPDFIPPDQAIQQEASQLQKPLTSEEVQRVRLSREQRIEEEKKRLALEQQANHKRFFVSAGLGVSRNVLYFGTFWTLAGTSSVLGIVTQNSTWALASVPIVALLLYAAGYHKAMSILTLALVAIVSGGATYLLMSYVPTLPYSQAYTVQFPFIGTRTAYVGREIFAGLIIGAGSVLFYELLVIFSGANGLSRQYAGIYSAVFTMGGVGGPIIGPFIWILSGFAIIPNWGFGFVPNLGYGLLSLLIGFVPGVIASSGLALGFVVVLEAQRDKSRIERKAMWDVLRAEWKEEEASKGK